MEALRLGDGTPKTAIVSSPFAELRPWIRPESAKTEAAWAVKAKGTVFGGNTKTVP